MIHDIINIGIGYWDSYFHERILTNKKLTTHSCVSQYWRVFIDIIFSDIARCNIDQ